MDNPATEPSTTPLNTDSAAAAFSQLLDTEQPQDAESTAKVDTEIEAKKPAEAEPAKAEDAEADAADADDPLVTVKIDGKTVEVPLSELKNGYQRQSDYTRKTMETAEQRKAAEAAQQQAQQERQAYAVNLQRMQAQLEGALQEQQKIDWQALLDSDPVEYLKQQHLAQQRQAAYQQTLAQRQQLEAMAQAERAQMQQRHLEQQQQELLTRLPDWRDDAKSKAEKSALREYLLKEGYSEQDVSGISDARAVILTRKAMLYDQMLAKASAAAKKVSNLPQRTERPGNSETNTIDKRGAAFQRLSKTGRIEDAASVFASLI